MCFLIDGGKTLLFVCYGNNNNIVYFIVHNSYCCLLVFCCLVFSWSGNTTLLLVDRLDCGDTNPTLVSLARFLQAVILCLDSTGDCLRHSSKGIKFSFERNKGAFGTNYSNRLYEGYSTPWV